MKLSFILITTFAAVIVLSHPVPAAAAFTVCNSSSHGRVNVAYAVTWQDSKGGNYGESQGWWIIDQDACKVIMKNDISAYTVYIYAYADSDPSAFWWGGSHKYCLDPSHKFLYHGDDMDTPCSSGRSFGLRYVNTNSDATYTYYLND